MRSQTKAGSIGITTFKCCDTTRFTAEASIKRVSNDDDVYRSFTGAKETIRSCPCRVAS